MEDKHLPDPDEPAVPAEQSPSASEPEATEIPLVQALIFSDESHSEPAISEQPDIHGASLQNIQEKPTGIPPLPERPESDDDVPSYDEMQPSDSAPMPSLPDSDNTEPSSGFPVEVDDIDGIPEESTDIADLPKPELPEEPTVPFDLSVLDDPDLDAADAVPDSTAVDLSFQDDGKDFEELLHAPAAASESTVTPRPPRKGRPKRKKGEGLLGVPNILATAVWLALILAIGVTAGRMLWVCAADVLAFGREDRPVTVTVYESDTMDDIIEKLYSNGLIRYRSLFRLYADISDAEADIDPGIYDLNTRYDYHALVNMMSASTSRTVVEGVLIPEGYSCRQIFSLLEEKRICTAVDLAAYASSGELKDYWFLEGVERGSGYCLEGFLFPDTYDFYRNSTPREVLEKLLDNFEVRFDEEMRMQIETLNANVTDGSFTVREVAIVASMIEKEAAAATESANIAGVIYNRLFKWNGNPPYLNIDASIVYALDGKANLTKEDLKVDSPYNTYTNTGLTPTPISNPGLSSLKAALSPASHNYYYYVLNPQTGMHTFSTSYEEHSAYVAAYAEVQ